VKIYIHGNCQGPALGELLSEACGPAVEVNSRGVHDIDLENESKDYIEDIRSADVVISQPVANNYRGTEILSTSWVRDNVKPGGQFLLFPVIYHRGQLPQSFTTIIHGDRMAYHDVHAVTYFLSGRSVDEFLDDTAKSDFLPADFVRSEAFLSTVELLRREASAPLDVRVSEIVTIYDGSRPTAIHGQSPCPGGLGGDGQPIVGAHETRRDNRT